jgi:methyl coenzyme M reductase gamma subunit
MSMTREEVIAMLIQHGIDPESSHGRFIIEMRTRSNEEIAAERAKLPPPKRVPPPGKTVWDMIVGTIPYDDEEDRRRTHQLLEELS